MKNPCLIAYEKISSLAVCEKEEKIISSNFVNDQDDQDVDISTAHGFEDEMQLYQAMKLRAEHGKFAMNIGATNILDQAYLDDNDDDSQASNDDDENSKRIRKTTHKYGIEIPTSVEHAFELDRKNANNLWKEALEMEMYNIGVASEILEQEKTAPAGYTKVSGHLIWSVKMDFTRKARWVLDGHKTPDPVGSKYPGVVSRESVQIAFTYAALNGLDVCMADFRNAYLQSPTS